MAKRKKKSAGTKRAKGSPGKKKLGQWKIKRVGDDQILMTVPKGMKIKGKSLLIEDIIAAGTNYAVVKKGRVLACCSGNIAIA